jgi:glycerophosphoryl diester phosphodiesterase
MGADFIEPDLVMTKDDFLVVRQPMLPVEPLMFKRIAEFPPEKTTKNLDGKSIGWFVSDFTLPEV